MLHRYQQKSGFAAAISCGFPNLLPDTRNILNTSIDVKWKSSNPSSI
ncbi:MAG: hypothetical protein IGS23_08335 [Rivularia sp. T60_A2020_040]|nr:hypothetical protein [Rivularia sp. T60_A2020_040]